MFLSSRLRNKFKSKYAYELLLLARFMARCAMVGTAVDLSSAVPSRGHRPISETKHERPIVISEVRIAHSVAAFVSSTKRCIGR